MRRLSELLPDSQIVSRYSKQSGDPLVQSVVCDSRSVTRGALFVARPGSLTNGHRFIDDALARGAVGIVHSEPLAERNDGAVYLQVGDAHRALSIAAARFYDYPARAITTIGVTGTDGKSTTIHFLYQLLTGLGMRTGFISTVASSIGAGIKPNPYHRSTPEAPELHSMLRQMATANCRYALIEATSHGLSARTCRLADVDFDVALFTNLGHDHLEFHGSLERYRDDKANLFRALGRRAAPDNHTNFGIPAAASAAALADRKVFGVVNADDHASDWMRRATTAPIYSFGFRQPGGARRDNLHADLLGHLEQSDLAGSRLRLVSAQEQATLRLALPGHFNAANALAALLTLRQLFDYPLATLCAAAADLKLPAGRLQTICAPPQAPFRVIVDYAHTPLAFAQLLPWVRQCTDGRLLVLFGSAGERDREKRPQMGRIAACYADIIVITDEDPRGEPAATIRDEIAAGARTAQPMVAQQILSIGDRRAAIRKAITMARAGDTLLLLGKGHEHSIIYADNEQPWDEVAEARNAIPRALSSVVDTAPPTS